MAPLLSDPESTPAPTTSKPHKRKHSSTAAKPHIQHIIHASTFRRPLFNTLHLRLLSPSSPSPPNLDAIGASSLLTSALTSYLGATGAAIPIDILKVEGSDVWIRVPRQDIRGVKAGVGGWVGRGEVGWRVVDTEDGEGVFEGEKGG